MFCCFVTVNLIALLVVQLVLVGLVFSTDGIVTWSVSSFIYPSALDAIDHSHEKAILIGLKLHSSALWCPDNDGSTPCEPAREAALNTEGTQAHDKASDESYRNSSALSDEHAPWHTGWSNSIAICATMRHENITDVVEWLSYYKYVPRCCAQTYKSVHWS
jgi:hypothetical protein